MIELLFEVSIDNNTWELEHTMLCYVMPWILWLAWYDGSVHGCEIASMLTYSHYYGREIDLFEILAGAYVFESIVYVLCKLKLSLLQKTYKRPIFANMHFGKHKHSSSTSTVEK